MRATSALGVAAVLASVCKCSIANASTSENGLAVASMPDGSTAVVAQSDVDFAYAIKDALEAKGVDSICKRRAILEQFYDREVISRLKEAGGEVSAEKLGAFLNGHIDGTVKLAADGDHVQLRYDHADAHSTAHLQTETTIQGFNFETLDRKQFVMITMPLFHALFEKRIRDLQVEPKEKDSSAIA